MLASWKLSVVLMVTGALYYAFLAIWARSSPPPVVQNIAGLLPYWAVYALLLLNTGFCLWKRLAILRRELRDEPLVLATPPAWEVAVSPPPGKEAVARLLRRLGYKVREQQEGRLWGLRGRWSALGTFLFHGAFYLLALGLLTTMLFREEHKLITAVGEEFTGAPGQVVGREGSPLLTSGPPRLAFTVEEIAPEFWRDQLLFTSLAASLRLPGGERVTTHINRPLWFGWGTFLRLSGFGYAPRYELLDRRGQVLESTFLKLNVFPPGQRDSFRAEKFPHRAYLELYPDLAFEEGLPFSKTMNLVHPGFHVRVVRGKVDLGQRVLKAGEDFEFEGLKLRFPEVRYWGEFRLVRDPGAPLLFLGFLVGLFGLGLKLRGKRAEVEWLPGGVLRGWGGEAPSASLLAREGT